MDGSNNSTCVGSLDPDRRRTLITVNSLFSAVGSFSCLLAILLILVVKAHQSFVYRLMLYLAIGTLCLEVSIGLQTLPTAFVTFDNESIGIYYMQQGWGAFCSGIAYSYQTFWFVQVFTIAWICVYVFTLSVLKVSLKESKHHVVGTCCIILLPLLISWIPFVNRRYGFSPRSYVCWIIDACSDASNPLKTGHMMQLFVSSLPAAIILAVGLCLQCSVATIFCIKVRQRYLSPQHWMALREIFPLLIYSMVNCVVTILGCCLHVYMMLDMHHGLHPAEIGLISSCFFQTSTILLPFLLFFHPGYKKKATVKLTFLGSRPTIPSTDSTTTANSHELRCDSPREADEKDALIRSTL